LLHTDERFHRSVEEAVTRIEKLTDAEIVVVAASRSGSYRDVSFAAASVVCLLTLILLVAIPYSIDPWLLILDLVVSWGLAAWVASGHLFVRLLTSNKRRSHQVKTAAMAEFHRESVHATPQRTGVLIYVSGLEGQVQVLPDLGIQGRIPGPLWTRATQDFAHADLDHFVAGLDHMGELLGEHVPALEEDLVDLPNAPRVRA
jgi:putative membrane protein